MANDEPLSGSASADPEEGALHVVDKRKIDPTTFEVREGVAPSSGTVPLAGAAPSSGANDEALAAAAAHPAAGPGGAIEVRALWPVD